MLPLTHGVAGVTALMGQATSDYWLMHTIGAGMKKCPNGDFFFFFALVMKTAMPKALLDAKGHFLRISVSWVSDFLCIAVLGKTMETGLFVTFLLDVFLTKDLPPSHMSIWHLTAVHRRAS